MTEKTKSLEEINVKRNKANLMTLCFVGDIKLQIFPGMNRITDQRVLECIANPKYNKSWLDFISTGIHEIASGKKEKSKSETNVFTAMASSDAITLVRETFSIPQLEIMYADEESKKSRKTVLGAIKDQITEMKTPDEKN